MIILNIVNYFEYNKSCAVNVSIKYFKTLSNHLVETTGLHCLTGAKLIYSTNNLFHWLLALTSRKTLYAFASLQYELYFLECWKPRRSRENRVFRTPFSHVHTLNHICRKMSAFWAQLEGYLCCHENRPLYRQMPCDSLSPSQYLIGKIFFLWKLFSSAFLL